jgi:hypothetical protein
MERDEGLYVCTIMGQDGSVYLFIIMRQDEGLYALQWDRMRAFAMEKDVDLYLFIIMAQDGDLCNYYNQTELRPTVIHYNGDRMDTFIYTV